jgi:hypothetical protein
LIIRIAQPAVLAISETWIDKSVTNNEIKIDGYSIERHDRERSGGGVCIYIKNNASYNPREDLQSPDIENVWIEIVLPKTRPIIVGAVYRPPKQCYNKFLSEFEQILTKLSYDTEKYILGDFNISFNHKTPPIFRNYSNILSIFNLHQLIQTPTRVTDHSSTILDHILCNNQEKVCQSGTINVGFSDHSIIYCTRKIVRGTLNTSNAVTIRSMKHYDKETYCNLLNQTDWVEFTSISDVNSAWLKFKNVMNDVIDMVAPVKEIKIKSRTEPWMTSEILEGIASRDQSFYKHRKNKSDTNLYKKYCQERNDVQRSIRQSKKEYLSLKFEENKHDSKKLWSQLKNLGYSDKSKEKGNIILNINDTLCYDSLTVANHINHFFTTIADVLVSKLPAVISSTFGIDSPKFQEYYVAKGITASDFKIKTVTNDFIFKELCSLNHGKSTGLDRISPRFLKDGANILTTPIAHIVNLSIRTGSVPDDLKVARVTPLYKKKSKVEVGNYRPVSVLSTVSKILEKSVYTQVESYLTSNKLIYEYQSGFRRKISTNTCLVYLTDYIKSEIGSGNYVGIVAIDVQKAFDCVNHDILCRKLDLMGIESTWFKSYLSHRKQIVNVNGTNSDIYDVKCGIPQGSLLGPLLYLCYCNDMEMAVKCKLILYADDSIIMVSDKDPKLIEAKLAVELQSINQWLIENKLSLHPGKCEAILFASKRKCKKVLNFSVNFNDTTIQAETNIKYLGSFIDQTLSGQDNVNSIVSKGNSRLKFLYRYKRVLNTGTRKILSSALIQGHMDYACVAWYYSTSNVLKHKLQVLQNKVARFILNKGPQDHIGHSELKSIGYLNVNDRVSQLSLNLVHSIYYNRCPEYLKSHFTKIRDLHSHNTRGSEYNFVVPVTNTITQGTYYYNVIKDWNSMPDSLRSIEDKDAFKRSLKTQ